LTEFQKVIDSIEEISSDEVEIIDVSKNPEKAEEHKIDALPTLLIGDKRFVGRISADEVKNILNNSQQSQE